MLILTFPLRAIMVLSSLTLRSPDSTPLGKFNFRKANFEGLNSALATISRDSLLSPTCDQAVSTFSTLQLDLLPCGTWTPKSLHSYPFYYLFFSPMTGRCCPVSPTIPLLRNHFPSFWKELLNIPIQKSGNHTLAGYFASLLIANKTRMRWYTLGVFLSVGQISAVTGSSSTPTGLTLLALLVSADNVAQRVSSIIHVFQNNRFPSAVFLHG